MPTYWNDKALTVMRETVQHSLIYLKYLYIYILYILTLTLIRFLEPSCWDYAIYMYMNQLSNLCLSKKFIRTFPCGAYRILVHNNTASQTQYKRLTLPVHKLPSNLTNPIDPVPEHEPALSRAAFTVTSSDCILFSPSLMASFWHKTEYAWEYWTIQPKIKVKVDHFWCFKIFNIIIGYEILVKNVPQCN